MNARICPKCGGGFRRLLIFDLIAAAALNLWFTLAT